MTAEKTHSDNKIGLADSDGPILVSTDHNQSTSAQETVTGDSHATTSGDIYNPTQLSADMREKSLKAHLGTVIAGRYRINSLLGLGGMGSVYKAEHIMLGSTVAIKILSNELTANENALKRFAQEAKAANSLAHGNIASVTDFGLTESGAPYFVMDLVDGKSLSAVIADEKALLWQRVAELGIQICDAMSHAHDKGIVHRDLKPANIIVSKNSKGAEKATVVDFGIAKLASETEAQKLTQTGEVFGSPLYMSPEQCTGKPLDRRSDIYSLGCLLYEALTGQVPFYGANAVQTILMQVNEQPPPFKSAMKNGSVPDGLETIVLHCLKKEPEGRYASMEDVKADLELVKRGKPPTKKNVRRLQFRFKRMSFLQNGIFTAVTTVAIFLGMAFWLNQWQYQFIPWQKDAHEAKNELNQKEYDQAIMSASHGIKIGIEHNAPQSDLCNLYIDLADGYKGIANGNHVYLDKAKEAYLKARTIAAASKFPKHLVQIYLNLGDTEVLAGDTKKAVEYYKTALSCFDDQYKDPEQKARSYIRAGVTAEQLKEFPDAENSLKQAIEIYKEMDLKATPALSDAWAKLGDVQKAAGKFADAEESFKNAIKLRDAFAGNDAVNRKFLTDQENYAHAHAKSN